MNYSTHDQKTFRAQEKNKRDNIQQAVYNIFRYSYTTSLLLYTLLYTVEKRAVGWTVKCILNLTKRLYKSFTLQAVTLR